MDDGDRLKLYGNRLIDVTLAYLDTIGQRIGMAVRISQPRWVGQPLDRNDFGDFETPIGSL